MIEFDGGDAHAALTKYFGRVMQLMISDVGAHAFPRSGRKKWGFLLAFETASFLLLLAAVGAVVLARKRRGLEEPATTVAVSDVVREGGVH